MDANQGEGIFSFFSPSFFCPEQEFSKPGFLQEKRWFFDAKPDF